MQAELGRLVEALERAAVAAPSDAEPGIRAALGAALHTTDWLPLERRRASHENYARHLLYADPAGRFSILSIVWAHGQASPIHGHRAWCAVGVCDGELTECFYRERANGAPELLKTAQRGAGSVSYDPAGGLVHRMLNANADVAISLHLYGTGSDQLATGLNRLVT